MLYKHKNKIKGGLLAALGFVLSPLTWWNDMLVNLPLAFGFAYVIGLGFSLFMELNLYMFLALVAVGYFLTNVLGFVLIQKGVSEVRGTTPDISFSWKKNMAYSFLAFLLVLGSIKIGLLDLGESEKLMASVLKVAYLK